MILYITKNYRKVLNQPTIVNKFTRNKLSQMQIFKTNKTFTVALSHEHGIVIVYSYSIMCNFKLTGKR